MLVGWSNRNVSCGPKRKKDRKNTFPGAGSAGQSMVEPGGKTRTVLEGSSGRNTAADDLARFAAAASPRARADVWRSQARSGGNNRRVFIPDNAAWKGA